MKPSSFKVGDKVMLLTPYRRSASRWVKPVPRMDRVYCVREVCTAKGTEEPAVALVGVTGRHPETGEEMVFKATTFRRIGRRAKEEA